MNERPKTPGQVCYEAGPMPCPWDSLFAAERDEWEKRAAAVVAKFTGPTRCDEQGIGISHPPPPPPPPPG